MIQTPTYKEGWKERYKIERKFGEAKAGHGLGRCRYLGLAGLGGEAVSGYILANATEETTGPQIYKQFCFHLNFPLSFFWFNISCFG